MGSLRAERVTLSYFDGDRTTNAVSDVTVELPSHGFFGVMGPSGSGKSSLLYLMSGLKQPTSGSIHYGSDELSALSDAARTVVRRERFGFVFQQPFLLSYLSAMENVLAAAPKGDKNAAKHAIELFEALGIAQLAGKQPYQMSGGERQRVCVARAMINRPEVIFADEPTAALDHTNGHAVIDLLASYRTKGCVIVVTHDPEMLTGADRVIKMRDGVVE
jgi:putative ABC transport system ATP-binding protein